MLRSQWSDLEAERFRKRYEAQYGCDVALRTYSARLLGGEASLVLHGGGNTSVKSTYRNLLGEDIPALFVKGSGWDLASIEPVGHPGLDLTYLRRLRAVPQMSDEVMVNELRTHLFDAASPTPSVETLLHAFLPAKFIDHSHADAILTLTNTAHGEELVRECFGKELVIVPYIMPGFALAQLAARCFEESPESHGMLLIRHGLFTFGGSAREAYERHLEFVNRAEDFVSKRLRAIPSVSFAVAPSFQEPSHILALLRGCMQKRHIFCVRQTEEILRFVNDPQALALSQTAPLTPDHVIRTKPLPLVIPLTSAATDERQRATVEAAFRGYAESYEAYVQRCLTARGVTRQRLDSDPRVLLIPGLGCIGAGDTFPAAKIAADLYEHTIQVKSQVARFAEYKGLPELDIFDVEYWGLEQAKLRLQKPKPLHGRVALVTGGTGAIGIGVARTLRDAGAEVVIADIRDVEKISQELQVFGLTMDVTSESEVRKCFAAVIARYGGIDIVVPNACIALSAPLEAITERDAHRIMEVNFHGYLNTIKVAAEYLKIQSMGGHIVLISSKNVFAPGKEFSIYSASKAAGHQIGKVAALELAPFGVRVNMVTPDAVFGGADHPSGLWQTVGPARAKARGLPVEKLEAFYQERNLLRTQITAEDVGRAVLFFVTDQTPTTGATLPVDGGVAEAFPR